MHTAPTPAFVDPAMVVDQLDVKAGDTVADFGCGSGFFSFEFAKRVGAAGVVYAFDVMSSALEVVASQAKMINVTNITTKRVNLEQENGSGLPTHSVDWVVTKDILFQNKNKQVIIQEVARVLKPGGQAVFMEWKPNESLVGPDQALRISPQELRVLIEAVGLTVVKELNVGGFHHALLVKK